MPNEPNRPDGGVGSRIQHTPSNIGSPVPAPPKPRADLVNEPIQVAEGLGPSTGNKIQAFGKGSRHEEQWNRAPNTTGLGAIHVKTFHSKLTADALVYMDQLINEWLDAHPQYEVKFVNSTVGILTGKLKDPNLICQVWV